MVRYRKPVERSEEIIDKRAEGFTHLPFTTTVIYDAHWSKMFDSDVQEANRVTKKAVRKARRAHGRLYDV